MNTMSRSLVLLERLYSAYGFSEFAELEMRQYELEIDDVVFFFFDEPEASVLYIQADIVEYNQECTNEALIKILKMNHLWDYTNDGIIGFDAENNLFSYTYKLSFPLVESDDYDEYLIDLLPELTKCIQYARSFLSPENSESTL